MKISTRLFSLFPFALAAGIAAFVFLTGDPNAFKKIPLKDRMDLLWQHESEITKDPATGSVPKERLLEAQRYAAELQRQASNHKVYGAIPGMNWSERGPKNVSGRTRAIMVDPNDATKKTVWVGSVGGGIWKTTDITAAVCNWAPVNDLFSNIAVSSIVYDPSNTQIFYFGTGEGWQNGDAQRGLGIWKSTDGGTTWNQLVSTNNSSFHWVQRLAVAANGDVYAATKDGVHKSTNGGTSFTKVLGAGVGAVSNNISDIEIASNGMIYAGVGIFTVDGVYSSSTGNAGSWTKLNTGANGFPTAGIQRIELACAPSNANVVYALVQNGGTALLNIYKTTNAGTSWTATATVPDDADPGIPNNDFSRGQAWYDFSLAVDPSNENVVFAGGVDLFKTSNGGTTWQQIAHWYGGFGFQYVHADQHVAYFEPGSSSIIYFGNDGGIWRSSNAGAVIPTIEFKGDNYNVTQFYGCAMHPNAYSSYFLAGAQDNGSQQYNSLGINYTIEVTGGDGCFMHIDQNEPLFQWTSYVNNNFWRSTNGGTSWSSMISFGGGSFVSPTDYENVSNILYAAGGGGSYLRWTNPQSGNTSATITITGFNGATVRHVSCSQNTTNRVFFGLNNGRVVRVDGADAIASGSAGNWINNGAGMPVGSVSCIAIQNGNDNHLLATYSNYGVNSVWETTNGGTSWISVEGNLPDMPVRWALFNPLNSAQAVIATELGIWSTDLLNGGATNWAPSNTGMANTRTDMLQIRASDNLMIAATHGRGLYSSDVFTAAYPEFVADRLITYTNKPIQFTDASYKSTSWSWNFGDATTSTTKNPVKTYSNPGLYTVTLEINGSPPLTASKTNYIHVLPNEGTPYAPAAGGNFEVQTLDFGAETLSGTPFQRGNSAVPGKNGTFSGNNAWVTGLTAANYADNTTAILYCPNYNFTAAGAYTLRFQRKNQFEIGWDGFRVEYSFNKGDSWTRLGNVAAGWYDFANNVQTTAWPLNEPYFNGDVLNYSLATLDVSFLAGNPNVAFRFVFRSDVSVTDVGLAIDDFEIIGPGNNPLPVELAHFTGENKGNYNALAWKTLSEQNNMGFDVERSVSGAGFEKIGFVKGAGTTSQAVSYGFEDRNLSRDLYFYRLKQIDFNGNFKYSNVIAVRKSGSNDIQVLFPNPFSSELYISFTEPLNSTASLSLFDLSGRKVFSKNFEEVDYVMTADFSHAGIVAGSYFLKIECGKEVFVRKIFKN